MKKTIIIVSIVVLLIIALCLGIFIAVIPDPIIDKPIDIYQPNSAVELLGLEKPNREVERLFAIKTYQDEKPFEDVVKIAKNGGLEYYEELGRGKDYLLIVPFEINTKMEISGLVYDEYSEKYVEGEQIFKANEGKELPDNYALLLRYTRPSIPQYQIKLTKGEGQTATYQIINTEQGNPAMTIQLVKDDIDINSRVEQKGVEIKLETDEEEEQNI